MSSLRVIASYAALLTAALAPGLIAQSVEIATRVGYAAPAGTLFRLANQGESVRAWDGSGPAVGMMAGWWPSAHVGVQASVDLRFTRYRADYENLCPNLPGCQIPDPVNGAATQVVASLRVAARRAVGDRIQLGASLGPTLIQFGKAQYASAYQVSTSNCPACGMFVPTLSYLPSHNVLALGVGVSVGYALSSRVQFSAGADDVIFRARPTEDVPGAWTSVVIPTLHQLTFSAGIAAALH
jgi:hypothetical protein